MGDLHLCYPSVAGVCEDVMDVHTWVYTATWVMHIFPILMKAHILEQRCPGVPGLSNPMRFFYVYFVACIFCTVVTERMLAYLM